MIGCKLDSSGSIHQLSNRSPICSPRNPLHEVINILSNMCFCTNSSEYNQTWLFFFFRISLEINITKSTMHAVALVVDAAGLSSTRFSITSSLSTRGKHQRATPSPLQHPPGFRLHFYALRTWNKHELHSSTLALSLYIKWAGTSITIPPSEVISGNPAQFSLPHCLDILKILHWNTCLAAEHVKVVVGCPSV